MKASFKLCLTLFSLSAVLLFNSCSSDQQYQWPEEKDQQVDINAPSDEGSETVTTGEELSTGDDKDNTSDDNSSSDQSIAEGEVVTDLVKMTKTAPEKASLGEPFKTEIVVEAVNNLASVQVKDLVPEGAELVKTEPEAISSGRSLVWNFGPQNAGDKETISIWLKPTQEGSLGSCASVTAVPRACVTTVIGKATLEIAKTGPEKALLGQEITYDIVVKNTGNALAKNVVVTDTIPDGLSHASGEKELEFVVGDLEPEESKTLSVTVKADARGKFCNNASAIGSNAEEVDDEACTVITQPGLKVVKTGTERQFTGKVATYDIQVTNIGDTVLNDVDRKSVV